MKNNIFDSLQNWYYAQCNNDWEHEFGIKIDTLDNPGWTVTINLENTGLEDKIFNEVDRQMSENDWIQCEVKEGKYKGSGGPKNLTDIIEIFINWVNCND